MASPAATQLTVERFLQQVQTLQKQAGTYEPGSIGGPTEHPSRTVDSNTHDKKEGARSAENNKDVKEQVGAPLAIVGEGEQPKAAIDSIPTPGLRAAATGEDPQNETQRAKRTKDDNAGQRLGRTTHPARADNPGLDSIKYAELSIEEHAKIAMDLGNRVLAGLSVRLNEPETPQETKEAVDAAAQVGWELAGLVDSGFDKQALDRQVHLALEDMIKSASDDADLVVEYLASFEQTRAQEAQAKQAQDRVRQTRSKQANMGGMPPEAAGGMPPGAEGGMPPEAGGMPPGAEGEMPPEGGADTEQLMAELEQMAQEKGVSVEELIQQLIGGVGGSDDSQEAPAADTGGMEIAAADKTNVKAAAPKRASATKNAAEVHRIVKELMSRSRR